VGKAIPDNVRFVVGMTPIPDSLVTDSFSSRRREVLSTWGKAVGADAVLDDLPSAMPDRFFAGRTHLNRNGVALYSTMLADSLKKHLGPQK
jgi:hypothetical protein